MHAPPWPRRRGWRVRAPRRHPDFVRTRADGELLSSAPSWLRLSPASDVIKAKWRHTKGKKRVSRHGTCGEMTAIESSEANGGGERLRATWSRTQRATLPRIAASRARRARLRTPSEWCVRGRARGDGRSTYRPGSGTTNGLLRLLRCSKNTQNTRGGRAGNRALRLPVPLGGLLVCLCTRAPWLRCRRPGAALPFGVAGVAVVVVCGLWFAGPGLQPPDPALALH